MEKPSEHKPPLLDAAPETLRDWLATIGEPGYRARQIHDWIFRRRADDFSAMTDLPRSLRQQLLDHWRLWTTTEVRRSCADDGTTKLLLELADNQRIECVLIPERDRRTVCLSTQAGCAMGCVFCASGLDGLARNLTRGEMLEQLLRARNLLPAEQRLTNIVVMGMGEPLANLDQLLPALAVATSANGLGISGRHVTVSTVGLPARIRKLADSGRPYHLAVSLHAPNDALRRRIIPTAEKVPLREIIDAADEYRRRTARQVTFEYILLAGINDADDQAEQLCRLLGRRDAFVNLIPYNPVEGLPYGTPAPERTKAFADRLRQAGLSVKVRKKKGGAIDAACGQLRRVPAGISATDRAEPAAGVNPPVSLVRIGDGD